MQNLNLEAGDWIEIISDNWEDLGKIHIVLKAEERENSVNMLLTDSLQSKSLTRNVPKNQIKIIERNNVRFQCKQQ